MYMYSHLYMCTMLQDGILFDNILVTHDEEAAAQIRENSWKPKLEAEKAAEKIKEEKRAAEVKKNAPPKKAVKVLYISIHQYISVYISIHQYTSAYISIHHTVYSIYITHYTLLSLRQCISLTIIIRQYYYVSYVKTFKKPRKVIKVFGKF